MTAEIVIAIIGLIGVIVSGVVSYSVGASRTKYDVAHNIERLNKLESKECPCPAVKELQKATARQEDKLSVNDMILVEIKMDLEYIKKAVEKMQK